MELNSTLGAMGFLCIACLPTSVCSGAPPAATQESRHAQMHPVQAEGPSPLTKHRVFIPPYLVDMGSESAELGWRTRDAQRGSILLTCLESGQSQLLASTSAPQQSVRMKGLAPDTAYRWQLVLPTTTSDAAPGSYSGTFSTYRDNATRRFAVLGHSKGSQRFGHYPGELLVSCIAARRPQFLVHTGDCVYTSTLSNWKRDFFDLFEPILQAAPIYVAPGNHDSGWPFANGIDLRPFKTLFPHPFEEAVRGDPGAAYYDFLQGPVHFIVLTYVTDLGPGSPQSKWIRRKLRSSQSEFRIVVLGGSNNLYDKGALQRLLTDEGVDLVLDGDGGAPKKMRSQPTSYPVFTLGSTAQGPAPWLDVHATAEYLVLREMDAMGKGGQVHWIYTKRRRGPLLELGTPSKRIGRDGGFTLKYRLPEPIESSSVSGLQFEAEGIITGRVLYTVATRPSPKGSEHTVTFPSQSANLGPRDSLATAPLVTERPVQGGPYEISEVSISFAALRKNTRVRVTSAWLY